MDETKCNKISRIKARELAMQMLFAMDAQKDFSAEAKHRFFEHFPPQDQRGYIDAVHTAYIENSRGIDAQIEESSDNWRLARMGRVDLAVMRVAAAECWYMSEPTPQNIAINEAVNVARKFAGDDSASFVNGVLGKIAKGREQWEENK
ncbi:MAG: transcription antitermination factor NusB [Clostridiales bacterium]|nr:transcription antitermination factor NusB [Clostridiales bacterium]